MARRQRRRWVTWDGDDSDLLRDWSEAGLSLSELRRLLDIPIWRVQHLLNPPRWKTRKRPGRPSAPRPRRVPWRKKSSLELGDVEARLAKLRRQAEQELDAVIHAKPTPRFDP